MRAIYHSWLLAVSIPLGAMDQISWQELEENKTPDYCSLEEYVQELDKSSIAKDRSDTEVLTFPKPNKTIVRLLKRHARTWTCSCGKDIKRKAQNIISHMARMHQCCLQCENEIWFPGKEELALHCLNRHPGTMTTRGICTISKKFYKKIVCSNVPSKEMWIQCDLCNKSIRNRPQNVRSHRALMHNRCTQCKPEEEFCNREKLQIHSIDNHPGTTMTRSVCCEKRYKKKIYEQFLF